MDLLSKVEVLVGLIYYPTPLAKILLSIWQGFTEALALFIYDRIRPIGRVLDE